MGDNTTIRLDPFNEPQPDVVLRIEPTAGGRSHISPDDYLEGAPELIVEVAASSATYDLREKKTVYQRNGVQEYIVWQIYEQRLDWFYLRDDEYEQLLPDVDGVLRLLERRALRQEMADVTRAIRRAEESGDEATLLRWLGEKQRLARTQTGLRDESPTDPKTDSFGIGPSVV